MADSRVGIIGGSGLYDIEGIQSIERIKMQTPFGQPSDEFDICELSGREIVFLPRHGRGHRILPSEVNAKANIWAMKKLGVEWIISVSAVGSLKKEIHPLDIVLVDQFVDRTKRGSDATFFGNGIVAHIMFARPICEELSRVLYEAGQEIGEGARIHWGGTYLNIEGPAFSTKAESNLYRSWGMDVIGMTNLVEAKLAREAEICYATVALVSDYDCWKDDAPEGDVNVEMVLKNLKLNVITAQKIIKTAIPNISKTRQCECKNALKTALVTPLHLAPQLTLDKLEPILGRYIKK
ncbi:S-methyl-5'-thioadenosine phosphorylase [bacterium]|nr:S-methyl-5'-thioadenosine phosphorylase [bacterium]RQV97955.1 MAG: S-methyl-5'-thioadenosine phosphorylase [bacterium]